MAAEARSNIEVARRETRREWKREIIIYTVFVPSSEDYLDPRDMIPEGHKIPNAATYHTNKGKKLLQEGYS